MNNGMTEEEMKEWEIQQWENEQNFMAWCIERSKRQEKKAFEEAQTRAYEACVETDKALKEVD